MNNNETFIMKPKVDFCFKELMEDAEVRQSFLAAVLRMKPEEIAGTELLPTVLRKEHPDDKLGILDVRVSLQDGTQVDIEIQVAPFKTWIQRSLFYLSKMYVDQIHEGEKYHKLKKCIHIGILDFSLFEDSEEYYSCFHLWEDTRHQMYSDKFEIHILELSKLAEYEYPQTELLNWARFLNAEKKEDFEMIAKSDASIDKAYQRLKNISADEQKRLEYEARQKAIRDYNSQMWSNWEDGHEAGLSEGLEIGTERGIELGAERGAVEMLQELEIPLEEAITKVMQKFSYTEAEARQCVEKYWK
jgi:predicted transposase/invertase (TIGR01784 family)